MRFFATTILLLAGLLTVCLAGPIPKLDEIYRKRNQGESESSIHAQQSHRDATPAWRVVRDPLDALSWDAKSTAARDHHKRSTGEISKMQAFVERFYRKNGMPKKAAAVEDIQVEKPKRRIKYSFAA